MQTWNTALISAGNAQNRYTLIEQSPNYSNRTFSGIIKSLPCYMQLIQYVFTNTYIYMYIINSMSLSEMPLFTDVSNCTASQ